MVLTFQQMVPFWFVVPSTLYVRIGVGNWMRTKLSQERSRRSIKFPVTPESMSAEVSMVLFSPCSKMEKVIDLLLGFATSTRSRLREGGIEASSLFKNPKLRG